jgi:anti-sigma regulatory factor (Ser/Thr protein kinase)
LRQQPLVSEMLESDVVNVRTEWKNERGIPTLGYATRVGDSNLYAAVEAKAPLSRAAVRQAWLYLAVAALGAIGLNWALFTGQVKPLLRQLEGAEAQVETLRRLMSEAPKVSAVTLSDAPIAASELPQMDFVESAEVAPVAPRAAPTEPPRPSTPLSNIVDQSLRALEPKLRELEVTVDRVGLTNVAVSSDILQLQTAFEEVLKNAVDSLAQVGERTLTIEAHEQDGRISLRIADTGTGVPKDNLPRIFEAFYSTRPQATGIARGLGLNVVRRIIEEIGGSVVARNTIGHQGFAVELTWPREPGSSIGVGRPAPRAAVRERLPPIVRQPLPSDLDLLNDADEEFAAAPTATASIDQIVRRPRVRTLD